MFRSPQTAVVQYGPGSLNVEMFNGGNHHDLKTEIQVSCCLIVFVCNMWCVYASLCYPYML